MDILICGQHLIHPSPCLLWTILALHYMKKIYFHRNAKICLQASQPKKTPIVWLIVAKYTTVNCTHKNPGPAIVPRAVVWVENLQYFINFFFCLSESTFTKILISRLVKGKKFGVSANSCNLIADYEMIKLIRFPKEMHFLISDI